MNKRNNLLAILCTFCVVLGCMSPMPAYAQTERAITKQPTSANPTVEVSDSEGAAYQWYGSNRVKVADVVDLTGTIVDGKMLGITHNDSYTEEDGIWYSAERYLRVKIGLQTGDILKVTPSEGFEGSVGLPGLGQSQLTAVNGVYSYTAASNVTSANLFLENETADFSAVIQVVRGAATYTVVNAFGQNYDGKTSAYLNYGKFNGEAWESDFDHEIGIYVYAEEGQVIQVTPSEGFVGTVKFGGEAVTAASGTYSYAVPHTDSIFVELRGEAAYTAAISICSDTLGEPVAGQTTNTLTEAEHGKYYACKVTYPEGEELVSSVVQVAYDINKQPTAANPTVGVNFIKGASYQWYNTEIITYNVIGEGEEAGPLDKYIYHAYGRSCYYNSEDGMWYDDATMDLTVKLNAGETLVVTPSEGFVGEIYQYGTEVPLVEESEGVYTYTAAGNEIFNFIVEASNGVADSEVSAKVQIRSFGIADAIEGENKAALSSGNYNDTYICTVTWDNGVSVASDYVTLVNAITEQPTAANPSVEVNFPENVKGYQWHDVSVEEAEVVDYIGQTEGSAYYVYAEAGVYADDVWHSEEGMLYFIFKVEAGDKIEVIPTGAEGDSAFKVDDYSNGTIEVEGDSYICHIEQDENLYELVLVPDGDSEGENYSVTVKLTKADGTVYNVQPYDYEASGMIEGYAGIGSYADGKWHSESNDDFEGHALVLYAELKAGDLLMVKPSEGFEGQLLGSDYSIYDEFEFTEKDGVYIYEVTKDTVYGVAVLSEAEFSAEIMVRKVTIGAAVEGQNTAELTNGATGLYACVVTLKDDTQLVSDYVEITEDDLKDDPEGGPEPIIPDKGDNPYVICYVGLLMAGMAMLWAGIVFRKRNLR